MDINNRHDIESLINHFYEKVKKDPVIGFIFTDIMKVDWEQHLPVMYDFWEMLILNTGTYSGNTLGVHYTINKKIRLEKPHFERWMELFTTTVDTYFEGPVATMTKKKARSIADLMQFKMQGENEGLKF